MTPSSSPRSAVSKLWKIRVKQAFGTHFATAQTLTSAFPARRTQVGQEPARTSAGDGTAAHAQVARSALCPPAPCERPSTKLSRAKKTRGACVHAHARGRASARMPVCARLPCAGARGGGGGSPLQQAPQRPVASPHLVLHERPPRVAQRVQVGVPAPLLEGGQTCGSASGRQR